MWTRRWLRSVPVVFLVLATLVIGAIYVRGQAGSAPVPVASGASKSAMQGKVERVEIAKGEYTLDREYGGIGPIEAEISSFRETWTLWQIAGGQYEVEGMRIFDSPKDYQRQIRFWLRLSPEHQLLEAKEFTSLMWIPRSSPLVCGFEPRAMRCSTHGKDLSDKPDMSLAMDKPYAFSWPLSAFSLAALTRRVDRRPGHTTEVQLVNVRQPSAKLPLMPMITSGKLRFLGPERVVLGGKSWQADKFELVAHMSPLPRKSLLWISADGLLLAIEAQREIGPKGRLELTRFENRADSSRSR